MSYDKQNHSFNSDFLSLQFLYHTHASHIISLPHSEILDRFKLQLLFTKWQNFRQVEITVTLYQIAKF